MHSINAAGRGNGASGMAEKAAADARSAAEMSRFASWASQLGDRARTGRAQRARQAAHRAARTRVPRNECRAQDASASLVGRTRSSCPLPHAAKVCSHSSERLLAFLDDLYILTTRERASEARDTVVQAVQEGCGIASNEGKTRVYSHAGGAPPPGIAELGADVWRGNKPSSERGLKVLGTPIGHPDFIASWAENRMHTERELLNQLPCLPDLQCAWLLLAGQPRAPHTRPSQPPHCPRKRRLSLPSKSVRPLSRMRRARRRLRRPCLGLPSHWALGSASNDRRTAWVRVARKAVGADAQVVPQQWLSNTTARGVAPDVLTW